MKKTNAILLGILTPAAVIAPIATLAACSCNNNPTKSEDQDTVDSLNKLITDSKLKFSTMYELMIFLNIKGIDLENKIARNNDQYVWDIENNKIFTIKEDGTASTVPSGYTMNIKREKIWKMVKFGTTSNHQDFKSSCPYGQYIVSGQKLPESFGGVLEFSTSVDVGYNEGYTMKYVKPDTKNGYIPLINTNRSTLEIEGTLDSIDHYGHARSLAITEIASGESYNEYGTVDGSIVIEKGKVVGKPGSSVASIIVNGDDASIELQKDGNEYSKVGEVAKTTNATKTFDDIINEKELLETERPKRVDKEIDPGKLGRYAGGLGTKVSPYIITTPEHLIHCSEDVSGESATALTAETAMHFVLDEDIDMKDKTFNPIGSAAKPFYGTFNGYGFTISNLTVKQTEVSGYKYSGLFGCVLGTLNESFNEKPEMWDADAKETKYENIEEYGKCFQFSWKH